MGPLPLSNGNQHILLIGGHFSKWYEAIPFPDQTAPTTATALLVNWICRFGCPHSIHSDQDRDFESKVFKALNQALQVDKTRTTASRPQSNAVVGRMNRTLQSMLTKCINEEQSNWSQWFPYVMMAHRTSAHERHIFLSMDMRCASPLISCTQTQSINLQLTSPSLRQPEKCSFKRHTIRPESPSISMKNDALQCVIEKSMDPPTKLIKKSYYITPLLPSVDHTNFFSPWRGPYVILQNLNDVTYRIQEIATQKELSVQYGRSKLFLEPLPTPNVPTRNKRNPKNVSTLSPRHHEQIVAEFDHDQCTWHYLYQTVPSATIALAAMPVQHRLLCLHVKQPLFVLPNSNDRAQHLLIPEFLFRPAPTPPGQPLHFAQSRLCLKPHHLSRNQEIVVGASLVVLLCLHR